MAHLTLAVLALAGALIGVGSTTGSPASPPPDCQTHVRSTTPNVADRLENQLGLCEGDALPTPTLATCVAEARRDGFRPADRLERLIRVCLDQATVGATAP